MRTTRAGVTRQSILQAAVKDFGPGVADQELIRRFADDRDETAFEILVRRHAGMVVATARRVLGDAHAAEDVCQAAFVLLAQKAAARRWGPTVAGWLHKTAHFLALKARTAAARRARREQAAADPAPANPLADLTVQELLAALDAELLALPEALRAPLVLCYLEGATRDEAADRLGCPLPTLKKRLERGRDRLHAALVRRGLGLPAALLGTLLVREAAAAPPDLVGRTARTAVALAAGQTAGEAVSPLVSQLVSGGIGMAGWNKGKAALGVLVLGGLLAGAGAAAYRTGDREPPPASAAAPADPPAATAVSAAKAEPRTELPREMRVVVLNPDGKPVVGANVHLGVWTHEKGFKANSDTTTDADGVARVVLPKTYTIVRLWASKKPFAGLFAGWEQAELADGKGVPPEYTFRLQAAKPGGGQVVDAWGKPVAGAKVEVRLAGDTKPAGGDGRVRYNLWLAAGDDAVTTDAAGRWTIDSIPDDPAIEVQLLVSHPDYLTDDRWTRADRAAEVTAKTLRDGTATVTLRPGVIVRGRVTDPAGKPIGGAVVVHGDEPYSAHKTQTFATDSDGRYRLPALAPGMTSVTVIAPGYAPQLRKVDVRPGLPDQDFRMAAGKPVRLRLIDRSGNPVPNATVWLIEWKGSQSIISNRNPNHPKVPDTGIPARSDADGVWAWPSAPDEPVKIEIFAKGFAPLQMDVIGGSTDRTVTLKAEHRITGTVTDAVTGQPIRSFTVIPMDVFRKDLLHAERSKALPGKNGRLSFLADRTDIPLRLRVEAPGYRSQDGPEFRVGDDGGREQNFRLRPARPVAGVVVDPNGRPAAAADVSLATPTEPARLVDPDRDDHRTVTDAAGRFEFPDPGEAFAVVARAAGGVAVAEFPADRDDVGIIRLRPWAAVRGRFEDGGKPVRGATVFISPIRINSLDRPRIEATLQAVTDSDGRFTFPQVPPAPVSVRVHIGPWKDAGFRSGPSVPLDLKPGERADLDLGTGGAVVTGRVRLTGKVPADLDCTYSLNHLVRREPGITPPPAVAAAGFDVCKGWQHAWLDTPEGTAYLGTLRNWFVKLAADGTFRVSGVPPGEYDLAVAVYAKPSGCLVDPVARRVVRVTVSAADAARGEVRVPDIAAEVVPVPAVGDTPALAFTRADGTGGSLADVRGKYAVVQFWASWCGPCKKQLPALRALHERYAGRGVVALGLSLDEDAGAWQAAVKGFDLGWPQGRLGKGGDPGVSSVPAYWLLDPAGKIVAKGYDLDELAKPLDDLLK